MSILKTALSQYGVMETRGSKDHPRMISYFDEIGFNATLVRDETTWCSALVNWGTKKSGYPFSGRLNPRSWFAVEVSTNNPELSDVVVLWRERPDSWKRYIGFYAKETTGCVYLLGGDQKKRVLDYKKLTKNG